jgi:hypothetical protein
MFNPLVANTKEKSIHVEMLTKVMYTTSNLNISNYNLNGTLFLLGKSTKHNNSIG